MKNKTNETEKILSAARDTCREAVEHVAMANYPHRESEALHWVANAFNKLYKELNVTTVAELPIANPGIVRWKVLRNGKEVARCVSEGYVELLEEVGKWLIYVRNLRTGKIISMYWADKVMVGTPKMSRRIEVRAYCRLC